MDRKKTILIAVLINAGLLAVLFVAALATQEETIPSVGMSQVTASRPDHPLFPEAADFALQQPPELPPIQLPLVEAPPEPLVHQLPPVIPEALPTPPIAAPAPQAVGPAFYEVIVKKGDNLDKIAKAHHTTVDEIIKINQLPSSFLRIGQVLKLSKDKTRSWAAATPAASASVPSGPAYYTVKVGDNPWTIARKHHMNVEELLKLNQLNEEKARKLKPGDRLRIR